MQSKQITEDEDIIPRKKSQVTFPLSSIPWSLIETGHMRHYKHMIINNF